VVPQLEVWDLAVLFGAVRPESDLSSEAVRLAALVSAVVSLVSMWTFGRDGATQTSLYSTGVIRKLHKRVGSFRFAKFI
jgi:hypothetical protein